MRFERVEGVESNHFEAAWEIYRSSFPRCERRALEEQTVSMQSGNYHFDVAIGDDGEVVGIVCYWIFNGCDGEFLYLEHLATSASVRNGGFGAKCLEYLKSMKLPILLEIEPPEDELTRRRQGFYERAGFVLNEYIHRHSPYRLDESGLELRIMTYPSVFSRDSYDLFCKSQSAVMPKF